MCVPDIRTYVPAYKCNQDYIIGLDRITLCDGVPSVYHTQSCLLHRAAFPILFLCSGSCEIEMLDV